MRFTWGSARTESTMSESSTGPAGNTRGSCVVTYRSGLLSTARLLETDDTRLVMVPDVARATAIATVPVIAVAHALRGERSIASLANSPAVPTHFGTIEHDFAIKEHHFAITIEPAKHSANSPATTTAASPSTTWLDTRSIPTTAATVNRIPDTRYRTLSFGLVVSGSAIFELPSASR